MNLIGISLLLTSLFAVVVSAVRMQPFTDPLAASTPDNCAAPCWHVFQPGITTDDDAFALFDRLGWTLDGRYCQLVNVCSVFGWRAPEPAEQKAGSIFAAGRLDVIAFSQPLSTLGDLLLMRGTPHRIDQYHAYDNTGMDFIVYRAYWEGIDLQMRVDCPTTFATLLSQPASVVTLSLEPDSDGEGESPKPPVISHSFRVVCR